MAPIATQTQTVTEQIGSLKLRGPSPPSIDTPGKSRLTEPLKYSGSLDKYSVRYSSIINTFTDPTQALRIYPLHRPRIQPRFTTPQIAQLPKLR